MIRGLSVLLLLLLVMGLAACAGDTVEEDVFEEEFEEVEEEARQNPILILEYRVKDVFLRGDGLYFCYLHFAPGDFSIMVMRMQIGTWDVETLLEIPWEPWLPLIAGFRLTPDGQFAFLLSCTRENFLLYLEYDRDGNRTLQREIADAFYPDEDLRFTAFQTIFTEEGYMVMLETNTRGDYIFHVIEPEGRVRSRWEAPAMGYLVQARDGQVLFATTALYELNLETGLWAQRETDRHPLTVDIVYSAPADSSFSIYLGTWHDLYGYNWDTGELSHLLNWRDEGVFLAPRTFDHLILLPEKGKIVVFSQGIETEVSVLPYRILETVNMHS